jgi:hypothetical protein
VIKREIVAMQGGLLTPSDLAGIPLLEEVEDGPPR